MRSKGRWGQVKALRLHPRGNKESPKITSKSCDMVKVMFSMVWLAGVWGRQESGDHFQ